MCTNNVGDTNHIIAGCSHMTARYYLPLRHDQVTKAVPNPHLKTLYPCKNKTNLSLYKKKTYVTIGGMYL